MKQPKQKKEKKEVKQAKIPKGMVRIKVLGSNKEKGHLLIVGVVPTWFAKYTIQGIIEMNAHWDRIKDEFNETRREKALWNKKK
jgi:hypothetical protein